MGSMEVCVEGMRAPWRAQVLQSSCVRAAGEGNRQSESEGEMQAARRWYAHERHGER